MTPQKLKTLSKKEVLALIPAIRSRIMEAVSKNGGHLSSNLGVVELTVALHRVFDCPKDKIVFDVGHQCYPHKIITGRNAGLDTLRAYGGLSGFPKFHESPCDIYETGHASTALSAALGLARARDTLDGDEHVIAVVGDGAFTGGMCYEALNDCGSLPTRLMVILNDNQMSIAPNIGALSNYLTYMRLSKGWLGAKKAVTEALKKIPYAGKWLWHAAHAMKNHVRNIFVKDTFFSALGFVYMGPLDGQDEALMEKMLRRAKNLQKPVVLHVVTQKGEGYAPAIKAPDRMHGTPPFDLSSGAPKKTGGAQGFGPALGEELLRLAQNDPRIVAVSAAMVESTGLGPMRRALKKRTFDVGITEEHAVAMAAGMARGGLRPVVAIYDTFMQRAFDQCIVDVALQRLPVVFLMDRAGIGGEDGPTHHGVFGQNMLLQIPNFTVLHPRCNEEACAMLRWALTQTDGPVAIRYPKQQGPLSAAVPYAGFIPGRWETLTQGDDAALVAVGGMTDVALEAAETLKAQGLRVSVIHANTQKPLDAACLRALSDSRTPFATLEEQQKAGGLGMTILAHQQQTGGILPLRLFALEDAFIPHGHRARLLQDAGLDAAGIARALREALASGAPAQDRRS